jgi:hypothetical protein
MVIAQAFLALSLLLASNYSGLDIPAGISPNIQQAEEHDGIKLCNTCATRALTTNDGVVFLDEEWKPDNVVDRCVLVHELVHVLQVRHGVDMKPAIAEPPAYYAQTLCLKEFGGKEYQTEINYAIKQAAKYGYGNYASSVK